MRVAPHGSLSTPYGPHRVGKEECLSRANELNEGVNENRAKSGTDETKLRREGRNEVEKYEGVKTRINGEEEKEVRGDEKRVARKNQIGEKR